MSQIDFDTKPIFPLHTHFVISVYGDHSSGLVSSAKIDVHLVQGDNLRGIAKNI